MAVTVEVMGDGHVATTPLTEEEQAKDDLGFTNPHLHRRIDNKGIIDPEIEERTYQLRIQGIYSYRTTTKEYYNYDVNEDEIP